MVQNIGKSAFIFVVVAFYFSSCGQGVDEKDLFKQITAQDSGFLQKKEALQILSMADVIDSTNIDHEKYIKENDTIAKYYKRTDNGNYLFSIKYDVNETYHSHILIECSSKGKVLKKEIYYHGTEYCFSNYYSNFYKLGDFFALKICSNGSQTYNTDLYLFKEITSQDSLNMIPVDSWIVDDWDIKDIKYVTGSSTMKLENDSLTVTYISETGIFVPVENGNEDEEKFKVIEKKEPLDVIYVYKNQQWHIGNRENYEKLLNYGFDTNVYF
ncbi:MAG: hypothetical protein FWH36_08455 [Lentimicrobiaceae bacterium]|nr:hypothetical protein [Lentimicrobiaceae bacterium]